MENEEIKTEEVKPTYLEEVKEEREKMEKLVNELRELKAKSIMGGNSEAGQTVEEKKPRSNKEYADAVLRGEVPK